MSLSDKKPFCSLSGVNSRQLAKLIFQAELPEEAIRTIPPQSLYLTIKRNGLGSSSDLIQIADLEQCRLLIDFDCWDKDSFNEDNFWEWLAVTDAESDLSILKKILRCIDLKLIAILISRYVETEVFEEATDYPPGPDFYSPDKGCTWIRIDNSNSDKHFLLGRLLALIFETNTELFYQLLAIPGVATPSDLEETSFQEKSKRLCAEGIPDPEYAFELNSPADENSVIALLNQSKEIPVIENIDAVQPLIYDSSSVEPLRSILSEFSPVSEVEEELTLLMNAAIIHWLSEFYDSEQVNLLSSKVKGAINIGLQRTIALSRFSGLEILKILKARNLYRLGLAHLMDLKRQANSVSEEQLAKADNDAALRLLIDSLKTPFPEMPVFLNPDGSFQTTVEGKLEGGTKALETTQEIESIKTILEKIL